MTKEFNSLEEIQKYYDEKANTYIFKEGNNYIDLVVFDFDLEVSANIDACNINARDINVGDINAWDINARDINVGDIRADDIRARNISYYAVCFAYKNIKCKSIKGRKDNAKHFVFDGTIEVEENE
jgi:hypothetical protein